MFGLKKKKSFYDRPQIYSLGLKQRSHWDVFLLRTPPPSTTSSTANMMTPPSRCGPCFAHPPTRRCELFADLIHDVLHMKPIGPSLRATGAPRRRRERNSSSAVWCRWLPLPLSHPAAAWTERACLGGGTFMRVTLTCPS